MKVTESFLQSMHELRNYGVVQAKNWPRSMYVKLLKCGKLEVPVLVKGEEELHWSPSLIDPQSKWVVIQKGEDIYSDTFGAVLLEKKEVYHNSWRVGMKLVKKRNNNLKLILTNGKKVDYFPTIPDILRLGWA